MMYPQSLGQPGGGLPSIGLAAGLLDDSAAAAAAAACVLRAWVTTVESKEPLSGRLIQMDR